VMVGKALRLTDENKKRIEGKVAKGLKYLS
jgi:hypothetical protein